MRNKIPSGLIVSCQAGKGEPLHHCHVMHLFAKCAVEGGAVGIRALGEDIVSIKREVDVCVIGLIKRDYADSEIYITPTLQEVKELLETGCEVIALDATRRNRPNGENLSDLVAYVRTNAPDVALMADIDDDDSAAYADELGFDYISTTLRGYTQRSQNAEIPDYEFIKRLIHSCKAKIIAEGGIWERHQMENVSACCPHAVVVGTSITRPKDITKRFADALRLG